MERLTIEDLLLIAEAVLDVPGERLARVTRLDVADAALAAAARRPALADQAAVLCERLVRDRPLPCGNKPVALLAMLELISRNRAIWIAPIGGAKELATTIERLATGALSPEAFAAWVRAHVGRP
jgi:prophage maintenance system killer protein